MTTPLPFYISEHDPPAKREILRAAMKLFSERGLAATSIRDIAQESGFTNPALYKHFVGKEELALHLFETCHGRVWASCAAALASRNDFEGKLDARSEEHTSELQSRGHLVCRLLLEKKKIEKKITEIEKGIREDK